MNALLKAENVSRRLEGEVPVTLVKNAHVEVKAGEFVVIMGPSGSGKSSLLYLLGLLDRPTEGRIWLAGEDTSRFGQDRLAAARLAHLGFIFQYHFLLPEFTAFENVMLPMRRLGGKPEREIAARAAQLLADVGLEAQAHKLPRQLSGGQSQRVAIARALANAPALVLADEPTGNLDSVSSANVRTLLKDISRQPGRAVVAVSHDPAFAAAADRVITIVDGKIQ